jgi:NifB/MoaA-like Fe-S oxidoreductase
LNDLAAITGWEIQLVPVSNSLFGPQVTVSGLLSGQDVLDALQGLDLGERVVLPRSMLDNEGTRSLDDVTINEMESRLGAPVSFARDIGELINDKSLLKASPDRV